MKQISQTYQPVISRMLEGHRKQEEEPPPNPREPIEMVLAEISPLVERKRQAGKKLSECLSRVRSAESELKSVEYKLEIVPALVIKGEAEEGELDALAARKLSLEALLKGARFAVRECDDQSNRMREPIQEAQSRLVAAIDAAAEDRALELLEEFVAWKEQLPKRVKASNTTTAREFLEDALPYSRVMRRIEEVLGGMEV